MRWGCARMLSYWCLDSFGCFDSGLQVN